MMRMGECARGARSWRNSSQDKMHIHTEIDSRVLARGNPIVIKYRLSLASFALSLLITLENEKRDFEHPAPYKFSS